MLYNYIFFFALLFFSIGIKAESEVKNSAKILPYAFIENKGQVTDLEGNIRSDISYYSFNANTQFFLRKTGFSIVIKESQIVSVENESLSQNPSETNNIKGQRIDIDFMNCNEIIPITGNVSLLTQFNFYYPHIANGIEGVTATKKLLCKNIYKNIDIEFIIDENGMIKYNFILLPGSNVSDIKLKYQGVDKITALNNRLELETSIGIIYETMPAVFLKESGKILNAGYYLSNNIIKFNVEKYNTANTLIIDPWITYLGGSVNDYGFGIAATNTNETVCTGETSSLNFPVSAGPFQLNKAAGRDAYIAKFNAGGLPVFITYYGGNGDDKGCDVTINNTTGDIYFAGIGTSGMSTAGVVQPVFGGGTSDVIVAKFNFMGVRQWATYRGGGGTDGAVAVALLSTGDLAICGFTSGAFPLLNASQAMYGGGSWDALIFKINNSGTAISWSTYFGGSNIDAAGELDVSQNDEIFVTGTTYSINLTTTPGTTQTAFAGTHDAFVLKLNPTGTIQWSTYFGGSGRDFGIGIAVNAAGDVTVSGSTMSDNLPLTPGAYQTSRSNAVATSAYVCKLSGTTGTLSWSTYYRGTGTYEGYGVVIDKKNELLYLCGGAYSAPSFNWPCALQPSLNNGTSEDLYVTKFNNATGQPLCYTYLGGPGHDDGAALVGLLLSNTSNIWKGGQIAHNNYNVFVTGWGVANFPVTTGAFQTTFAGSNDAVVFRICGFSCGDNTVSAAFNVSDTTPCIGEAINFVNNSSLCDNDSAKWVWTFIGANQVTSTLQNPTGIYYQNPGYYTVKLLVITPCGSDSITYSNYIHVTSPNAMISVVNNVKCFGENTGSATVGALGGTPPYLYSWSNGNTTASASGFSAGVTYTVTITDNNNCMSTTTVTVTQPPLLTVNTVLTNSVSCFQGNNGIAGSIVNGGTPPYTYLWSNGTVNATNNMLASGNYFVTVTDNYGCTATSVSVNIPQPLPLVININSDDALCNGTATGTATVSALGGAGGYNYVWNNGQSQNITTGLSASVVYSVTVTDVNGCTLSETTTISEPVTLAAATLKNDAHCNQPDGEASVIVNGGTPGYSFNWSNGANTSVNTTIPQGLYTVTVTDNNGCTISKQIIINNINGVAAQTNLINNVSCNNGCDGTATAIATGGNGPYVYSWSNGQNNNIANNLCAGNYSVTITDNNGCTSIATIAITQPAGMNSAFSVSNVSCNGKIDGSASVIPSGGTGAYTYAWNNNQATPTATGLAAGIYSCTITDANGCTKEINNVVITQPLQLSLITSTTVDICFGKQTTLTASAQGGTSPYSYIWSNTIAGTTITVAPTSQSIYSNTVTDSNGCVSTSNITVNVNELPTVSFISDKVSGCAPLCVEFINTTPNTHTVHWLFGNNNTSSSTPAVNCYNEPGSYHVTLIVTDNNGCSNTILQNNYITVHPNPKAGFSATPQPATVINSTIYFKDESLTATSWVWAFGDANASGASTKNPFFEYPDTGNYEVSLTITNEFGCTATTTKIIRINPDHVIYIPNTFTPNGDGKNDFFMPLGLGINSENYEFLIFDRWGSLIFKSTDPINGWDGRANNGDQVAQQDTYVWKLSTADIFGKKHRYAGHVNLIR